eukprot:scaffold5791_cov105-Skeletonema_dohrnii-CCMP3373.AAC.2
MSTNSVLPLPRFTEDSEKIHLEIQLCTAQQTPQQSCASKATTYPFTTMTSAVGQWLDAAVCFVAAWLFFGLLQ